MLPRWEDLPQGPMTNRELVDHIKRYLSPVFDKDDFISTTRIQNYVKWKVLSPPEGRRYMRIHLVEALILTILKEVLTTEEIAQGIRLQLLLLSTKEAYEAFVAAFNQALEEIEGFISYGYTKEAHHNYPALSAACRAFAYSQLTRGIIKMGGYDIYKGDKKDG